MKKLSVISVVLLLGLAGVGSFVVLVFNPFNTSSHALNLQPQTNIPNQSNGLGTNNTTTAFTSATTSSIASSSTPGTNSSSLGLLTNQNTSTTQSGNDDGGSGSSSVDN